MSQFDVKRCNVYRKQTLLKTTDLETLLCPSCGGLLRDPVQVTACGDRFCRCCIEKLMSYSEGPYRCPVDNEEFVRSQVRTDRGCLKELQSLEIECITRPTPCNWRGPLTKLDVHQTECPNVEVDCSFGCGRCLLKSQLSSHVSSQCPNRPAECPNCKTNVPKSRLEVHQAECPNVEVDCSLGCGRRLLRSQLSSHVSSQCPNRPAECQYCKTSVPQSHLEVHLTECPNVEMECSLGCGRRLLKSQLSSHVSSQCPNRPVECGNCKTSVPQSHLEVKRSLMNSMRAEMVVGSLEQTSKIRSESHCKSDRPRDLSRKVDEIGRTVDTHSKQLLRMEASLQNIQKMQQQMMRCMHAVVTNEVRCRPDTLDTNATESKCIWKISNFYRCLQEARDGQNNRLCSPPFYTHTQGYKMCIRVYLNGDGIGKGTHMSVFFILMRSEHDNLLPWPFKQSVRFTLINQKNQAASITEVFVPDLSSTSFQQPQTEMNVASGFPKFAHQSVFCDKAFTSGDAIYIKCQVEKNMDIGRGRFLLVI